MIDFLDFKEALHLKKSFFAKRFFSLYDNTNTGRVNTRHLLYAINRLYYGTKTDKLNFLFKVYDVSGNDVIDWNVLRTVLLSSMKDSGVKCTSEQLDTLTDVLFNDADRNGTGVITFEDFRVQLEKYPEILDNLTTSATSWLNPSPKKQQKNKTPSVFKFIYRYLGDNQKCVAFLACYVLLNMALFAEAGYQNYGAPSDVWIAIAKGSGRCLSFNTMFIVILMLRKCLTWLRRTMLGYYLPLDDHVMLHKMVGWIIVILSIIHTVSHLLNLGFKWNDNLANLTGLLLVIILIIIVACSLPFVRRNGYFQLFYWTHQLIFLLWAVLIAHAPYFWIWFLFPGILYVMERILRTKCIKRSNYGKTYIKTAKTLPSKVVHLRIKRPPHFNFQCGEYVYINIPRIAKYEWHPFTISSAPQQLDTISLHIRAVGNWTKKLHKYYSVREACDTQPSPSPTSNDVTWAKKDSITTVDILSELDAMELQILDIEDNMSLPNVLIADEKRCDINPRDRSTANENDDDRIVFDLLDIHSTSPPLQTMSGVVQKEDSDTELEVYIDGPYGSPSQHIFDSQHAVLIGAGIGVTPFASILQSINEQFKSTKNVCPKCRYAWREELPETNLTLKKVDFYWINRSQTSFEWFVNLLNQLEQEQSELSNLNNIIDFHLYMTSARGKGDLDSFGLQMALDLIHKKENRDMITGLMTKTNPGKPDWDEAFQAIAAENKGDVTVFYCGPSNLASILKRKCCQYNFKFRQENF
ncbi:NADPH oxidase 5-like [Saccoglossus kowalevskii]|uniref:NADPH oxidase 5-like n=1 Tax=Saccoglossus kowalevskii TaxID=10224 RepID=A0ABM0MTP2_SACKO|nr:PREDICTED: NADPH oxidase 5-like [Saccoglossus kowalevskii]